LGIGCEVKYLNSGVPDFSAEVTPRKLNRAAATQQAKIETLRGGLGVRAEFSTVHN
jgi:hypothetical protein